MRDQATLGASPLKQTVQAKLLQNAGHVAVFFPFSEWVENASATTVSDLSGTVTDLPIVGTTAGFGAAPANGITLTTDNFLLLNNLVSGLDTDRLASIYDCTDGYNKIIYFGGAISIAATPTASCNYLLSLGGRDDVGANLVGQLNVRINNSRKIQWHLHERAGSQLNEYADLSTAITLNTVTNVFGFVIPGTSNNCPWYLNGVLNNTATLATINDTGPIAEPTTNICLFARAIDDDQAGTRYGALGAASAATNPTARNWIIGSCSNNANNQVLLPQLAAYLANFKRLPAWIDQIT